MVDINKFNAEKMKIVAIMARKRKADQEKIDIMNEILAAAEAGLFSIDLKIENLETKQWLRKKDFNITSSIVANYLNVSWAQNTVDNSVNNPYA